MKKKFLFAALIFSLASLSAADGEPNGAGDWKILSKQNFSSQIHLHPHILLFVTVPWCGESRSLMKDVSRMVAERQEFGSMKLMFVYRSTEKTLANAIGAGDGISVFYYHHSVAYRYRGKLRAQNVLHSILQYLAVSPEELPLKRIESQDDLKLFLESKDRVLLLGEFCGWTPSLMAKVKSNGSEDDLGIGGALNITGFIGKTDIVLPSRKKNHQKVAGLENGQLKCGTGNGIPGIPWLPEFSSLNESASFSETENVETGFRLTCTFEEFQQFELFFSKLILAARDFSLPPERLGFGLVSNIFLLSSLGVRVSGSWLAELWFNGCPRCSKVLKDGDALISALEVDSSIVPELQVDELDLEPALPANKPSVILFVDRSAELSETRRKSRVALDAVRELASRHQMPGQIGSQSINQLEKLSIQSFQEFKGRHPRVKLPVTAKKSKLTDKMSVMVINEGKHVSLDSIGSDLQGSSLHEILTHLLQRGKEAKLSSLAKQFGFRLLSEDQNIQVSEASATLGEVGSNMGSLSPFEKRLLKSVSDSGRDQMPRTESTSAMKDEKKSEIINAEPPYYDASADARAGVPSGNGDKEVAHTDESEEVISLKPAQVTTDYEHGIDDNMDVEKESSSRVDNLGEQELKLEAFKGSFFFSDSNYRLLRSLTGESTFPSLVVIDPTSQKHYVFPKDTNLSYVSLFHFLHGYLNESLIPYHRSESISESPREAMHPPFVNLDFHETDSIPRVTTRTFSKLLFGLNQSDDQSSGHACNEDVVVLFSSNWCGFCQRMELVVREVYRAVNRKRQTLFSADNNSVDMKLPQIYLMDCTLNDCGYILKSIDQREVYPSLMLFPAESKRAIPFGGDLTVTDIIKFIAQYGSYSRHLFSEKGIVWTRTDKGEKSRYFHDASSQVAINKEDPVAKDNFHEVLLRDQPKRISEHRQEVDSQSRRPIILREPLPRVVVGSVLVASDKLVNASPFDKSTIIIVKADRDTGFQGLIFNKHISWDSLNEVDKSLEFLREAPLSFGGPIIKQGMPLVGLKRSASENQFLEVQTGVYFLDHLATVDEINDLKSRKQSITDYWFFLGYAGWDWEQLFAEIEEGAWTVSNDDKSLDWPWSS